MALTFPTTANIITIINSEVRIDFALRGSDSGISMSESLQYSETITDMPQAIQDAITTLKNHIEASSKRDCEGKGYTFI